MSAQDPFYLVKEEIQDSVDKVQATQIRLEKLPIHSSETEKLLKELSGACESVEWQIDELNRAIAVAERDPDRFGIDSKEIENRKKWTFSTSNEMKSTKKVVERITSERLVYEKENSRRELLRLDNISSPLNSKQEQRGFRENEKFLTSQEDRQSLLLREQDAHLDEMSESLAKLGGMGIAIHEELGSQNKLINEIERDVDTTNSRLSIVQKKMIVTLKKAGVKGQLLMPSLLLRKVLSGAVYTGSTVEIRNETTQMKACSSSAFRLHRTIAHQFPNALVNFRLP